MNPPTLNAIQLYIDLYRDGCPDQGIEPHNDPTLLDLWSPDMETQLQADPSRGTPVEGRRGVYSDGANDYWSIRVPRDANCTPTWDDRPIGFAPAVFSRSIGMTGWDWRNKVSRWVAFDFDSITGHAKGIGISQDDLEQVKAALAEIPWLATRRSTRGGGLHAYAMLGDIADVSNHTEHAALARAVLAQMSEITGFDFAAKVDGLGGNTWFAAKSATRANQGFALIKGATSVLSDLPNNWRDNLDVIKQKRTKVAVQGIDDQEAFGSLAESQHAISLDAKHREIIDGLRAVAATEWVADHRCIRTHTDALARLPNIKGIFRTVSEGQDLSTPNCFCFLLPDGGLKVVRFSPGIQEAPTWTQDGTGWTTCEFNVEPTLSVAALACNGLFDGAKDGYYFQNASDAVAAIQHLGQTITLNHELVSRDAFVCVDKSGHIALDIDKGDKDRTPPGFIAKKSRWFMTTRIIAKPTQYTKDVEHDIRLVKTPERQDVGWLTETDDGSWDWTSRENLKSRLVSLGVKKTALDYIIGDAVGAPWTLVNVPFAPIFPGGRRINFGAAQYRYSPADADGDHPTWDSVLNHCFGDLDEALKTDQWAMTNGVRTGADYALLWLTSLLKEPFAPLPYLFLFGGENCGKSTFHEAIKDVLLIGGVKQGDRAFTNKNDFNGELLNLVLCFIEETDFSDAPKARERLKSWVTGTTIQIRKMRTDAFDIPNTLHFIHTANTRQSCPTPDGDTRITMCAVSPLTTEIPKPLLMDRLKDEAPQFMRTIDQTTLPPHQGRLRVPAIDNETKRAAQSDSRDVLRQFVEVACTRASGQRIAVDEFKERIKAWTDTEGCELPPRNKMYVELANMGFPRKASNGQTYLTNIRWTA